jgi:dihydroflavonol-4-reductase
VKVLVTGATGLVGARVVRRLESGGHQVRALVRRGSDQRGLSSTNAERVRGDLTNADSLRRAAEGVEAIVHCAAVFSYWGWTPEELRATNVDGTTAVLTAAHDAGVRRVVVTSSSVTLGSSAGPVARGEDDRPSPDEPSPDYFRSKVDQEQAALDTGVRLGLDVVVANPTIVVGGPDWRLVPSNALITRYLADPSRTTFPGGCNIVSVRDVADGLTLLLERGEAGTRYVLGGENWTWASIHRTVSELAGTWGPGAMSTPTAAYLGAAGHELLAWITSATPAATRAEARTVGRYFWYRHDRAAALGYQPSAARQALAEAVAWLVTSPHLSAYVRAWLRPTPEVFANRELVPRALT